MIWLIILIFYFSINALILTCIFGYAAIRNLTIDIKGVFELLFFGLPSILIDLIGNNEKIKSFFNKIKESFKKKEVAGRYGRSRCNLHWRMWSRDRRNTLKLIETKFPKEFFNYSHTTYSAKDSDVNEAMIKDIKLKVQEIKKEFKKEKE